MTKIACVFTLLVTVLVCLLPAIPAQAAAARTFVSAAGSDSNNCTNVLTPCRHLAAAYAATTPNGEIYVLDPANYGSLTITGPVSIEGHGWASIAPASGSPAITVNASAGDSINIIGVVLDGTALPNTTGIQFNSGGTLKVRDSVIRNFTLYGINFQPNSSSISQFSVSNTLISDSGSNGVRVGPTGLGSTNGVLNHVEIENTNGIGLLVISATQTVNLTVTDSACANNASAGINGDSISGALTNILVRNSTIANNGTDGLLTTGAGATIRVTRSAITGNFIGWAANGGAVLSYGDNNIDGNGSANTEPPNPLTYK